MSDQKKVKQLVKENAELKQEIADNDWAIRKTNDGIKLLYKELENKNRELEKLDQMKSDFVSTVSHELRTPMAIIKESIAQILDGILGEVSEDQEKVLNMALNNIDRLSRIVNNLLDISKIEAGKIAVNQENFDIVQLSKEVCENFRPGFEKDGLQLENKSSSNAISICADRDKLVQVFTNLIGNAMKFTEEGGVTVSVDEKDGAVECTIADTGVGISKEDLGKVFGKFQQFGRKHGPGEKGTGLGLAISKGIVELHKGNIWVESKLDEGTKFIFTLPKNGAANNDIEHEH